MPAALLVINIVVWAVVLIYTLRLVSLPGRRWSPWAALMGAGLAALLSFASYRTAVRRQVHDRARNHYDAGLDEKRRGNLQEAEKEFEEALALQPGDPRAERELQEVKQQKPAEKREQKKEARIDPTLPAQSTSTEQTPPPKPANAPPTPPRGHPGEKARPASHTPSPFEITHYALDVEIDPAAHTLKGSATIQVRSRGAKVPALDFSLNPEFKPSAVQVDGAPAAFRHTNDLLAVTPVKPLPQHGTGTVTVQYHREGNALVAGGDLISPEGTYLRSEARWYPATGELDFRSPVRVRARVPRGYSVVSVGELKKIDKSDGKTTLFHWETDRYASMVSLAAARYEQQSVRAPLPSGAKPGSRPELKITCYTFPKHKDRAALFLKEAAAIVRFYERQFGPYPYEKLGVVEIPHFPGGYGTTSFVMLIDVAFQARKVDREFLAHEIAHQWWGNSVFPQGLGAAWLTEAFANYSAWMYDAAIQGNPRVLQKRVDRATRQYFEAAAQKGDQPIYETDPYRQVGASEEILYEKGAVVLHMLRRQVGDRAFLKILRRFADQYRFGKAKIEDFQRLAEKESGQQLGWFFDQWLGRTGGMAFEYSFATQPDTAAQNRAVLTVNQTAPAYRAKMKVVLEVEDTVQTQEVELTKEHETFSFPVKGKLTKVLFDPDNAYLMKPPKWVVPETETGSAGG
jgi:aminopeptidase N